jgi:hypothetical protein
MVFDDQYVIAPCVYNGLRYKPLGQQGIHGEHSTRQAKLAQHLLGLRTRMGLLLGCLLGHGKPQAVGQSRSQWAPKSALLAGAPQRFAVEVHGGFIPAGAAGGLTMPPSVQAPRIAFKTSRSPCRHPLCSVAAQRVVRVKPNA